MAMPVEKSILGYIERVAGEYNTFNIPMIGRNLVMPEWMISKLKLMGYVKSG